MVHIQGLLLTISSELAAYFCSGTPSPHSYLLKVLTKALLLPSSILECFLYCEISEKKNDIFTNLYFLGVQHIVSNYLMAGWLDGWMDGCRQEANLMLFSFSCLTSYKAIINHYFFYLSGVDLYNSLNRSFQVKAIRSVPLLPKGSPLSSSYLYIYVVLTRPLEN